MNIIYFSPHLDDVAFSCGGLVWQQVQEGHQVSIWTLFSGDPPTSKLSDFALELHQKWQFEEDASLNRREEDKLSCQILGVSYYHLNLPDCIYRLDPNTKEHIYTSDEDLFGGYNNIEEKMILEMSRKIKEKIDPESIIVSPLSVGDHVDHQICRKVVENLKKPNNYYFDFPYVEKDDVAIEPLIPLDYKKIIQKVSQEAILKWQESIEAHKSQISSFWENPIKMRKEIQDYSDLSGGINMIVRY